MRISVPASVANLGPGFDVLAMAVDLWLEVEAEESDEPEWEFEGEGAERLQGEPNPLSVLAMRGWVRNGIPVGVGLGSSAAARVAAASLRGSEDPIGDAGREEGHYDNAAAAVMGGVVAVVEDEVYGLPVPELEVALFIAPSPLATSLARSVLPEQVSRADAVFNLSRLAALIQIMHSREWSRLDMALEDRLHQPHRLPLFPWVEEVMVAAREAGAYGAALAGAGPSVFALCERKLGEDVALAMEDVGPEEGYGLVTKVTRHGLDVRQ
jgi:homoserine kinase